MIPTRPNRLAAMIGWIALAAFAIDCGHARPQTRQEHVHHRAGAVMPFDASKTTHVFEMTEAGGIQQVVSKDPGDAEEVALIQGHLRYEAERFQNGDFTDPAALHGEHMPGLRELSAGADRLTVTYTPLAHGGEIRFVAHDPRLVTAIHRWFGAQLSDHGADATSR